MTKTFRVIDRKVRNRYLIVQFGISSDWASRNPWTDGGVPLPYFSLTVRAASTAILRTYVAGPFCLHIGY